MFFFPPFFVPPAVIEIVADPGGFINMRADQIAYIKRHGYQVRILGQCNSSCTMYLSLPRSQVCISPNASLGFHSSYNAIVGGRNDAGTQTMLNHYPNFVLAKLKPLSPTLQYLSGAILLPYMRRCT